MELHKLIAISHVLGMQGLCRAIQSFVNRKYYESAELYLSLFLGISVYKYYCRFSNLLEFLSSPTGGFVPKCRYRLKFGETFRGVSVLQLSTNLMH